MKGGEALRHSEFEPASQERSREWRERTSESTAPLRRRRRRAGPKSRGCLTAASLVLVEGKLAEGRGIHEKKRFAVRGRGTSVGSE